MHFHNQFSILLKVPTRHTANRTKSYIVFPGNRDRFESMGKRLLRFAITFSIFMFSVYFYMPCFRICVAIQLYMHYTPTAIQLLNKSHIGFWLIACRKIIFDDMAFYVLHFTFRYTQSPPPFSPSPALGSSSHRQVYFFSPSFTMLIL